MNHEVARDRDTGGDIIVGIQRTLYLRRSLQAQVTQSIRKEESVD